MIGAILMTLLRGRRSDVGLVMVAVTVVTAVVPAEVVITEVHYAPADKAVAEEFVEIFNTGPDDVDLSGWSFTRGVDYTFPDGVVLAAKKHLVIAQDPSSLAPRYPGIAVLGSFRGRLSNSGERLRLVDRSSRIVDELRYENTFPWPIVDRRSPCSIELIDPALDNSRGGSWRRARSAPGRSTLLVDDGATWHYRKGLAEPSVPNSQWRTIDFDDSAWVLGASPIGFGERHLRTVLPDMRGQYSSVFLRRRFEIDDPSRLHDLVLDVSYDDGFVAWINGHRAVSVNVSPGQPTYRSVALIRRENFEFETFRVPDPQRHLRAGTNVLSVQLMNGKQSSDAFIDLRLRDRTLIATPGAKNSVRSSHPPVYLGKVKQEPERPGAGDAVTVSVEVESRSGIRSVRLEYQIVDPGSYIAADDPEFVTSWRSMKMRTVGRGGTYTATLVSSVQRHRRLVRYRLAVRSESGETLRAPSPNDPRRNFAYFVYDGLPAWKGAIQLDSADQERARIISYDAETLGRISVYHLIAKKQDVEDATWWSKQNSREYRWSGTLVYEGEVYDHVRFRARGGTWRYAMGKNMWKFNFPRTRRFRARDNYGRKYRTRWDKLNLSSVIQQAEMKGRGEQGLFESVTYRLFNLAGVDAPHTHFVHLRIIDELEETGATQYDGDFWGLYLAIEQMDGRFLREHGLGDGNLYKVEMRGFDLNHLGSAGPSDGSDVRSFVASYRGAIREDAWWREHFDLDGYFRYRAIVEAVHHYDTGQGKNYFYYDNPRNGRWTVLPWDVDITWGDHMFGNGRDPFVGRLLARPAFALEYRNHVREIRDLLFHAEQAGQLIDEYAAMIDDPDGGPAMVDADRARWDYHPVMVDPRRVLLRKAGQGRFYLGSPTGDFPGMVRLMKDYVDHRGRLLDQIARDPLIPKTPEIQYLGPTGFPGDGLRFRVSPFVDPQGAETFAAVQWRLAEVSPHSVSTSPHRGSRAYEADAVWKSRIVEEFQPTIGFPSDVTTADRTYRARIRMRDSSGRWSHWSRPVEFRASD